MNKCGDCVLGVIGGAICKKCNGTTFVQDQPIEVQETVVQKIKKAVSSKKK